MKPLDSVKLGLLLLGIIVWFLGYRENSQPLMIGAMAIVVVAFVLRFMKTPPAPPAR